MENTRNFCILAHIDHGKSTLADRLIEKTGTVKPEKMRGQLLDQMDIERERGITIKLAPVRMEYQGYILNLIDTPGHVDFTYEVSRSLAAVEGAILLVDATQGIQAQTLSNYYLAEKQSLKIIPVLNKIDLPAAEPDRVAANLSSTFGFLLETIIRISAKTGENVEKVLQAVVNQVPAPHQDDKGPRALIFDSHYDSFKGVIASVRVFGGQFKKGAKVKFLASGSSGEIVEAGIFSPEMVSIESLVEGSIGYIATGLKDASQVRVGDTLTLAGNPATEALPGYRDIKPLVFAGFYPTENDKFPALKDALEKLRLNDAALSFEADTSTALGFGFRCGFLGLLHFEVVQERIEREYGLDLIASSPTVRYKVTLTDGKEIEISNPTKFPSSAETRLIKEPIISATIVTRETYLGAVLELVNYRRGKVAETNYIASQVVIKLTMPLAEVVSDFYDKLKSISSGYASFDYDLAGWESVEAVKMEILVAKEPVDALSQIVTRKKADEIGKKLVEKLKEIIPRQNFEISLQAAVGGKILARADIPAFRKDVLAKLYGGDRTRKDKLLEKQKKGKKRMKSVGRVEIPQEAFLSVLKI